MTKFKWIFFRGDRALRRSGRKKHRKAALYETVLQYANKRQCELEQLKRERDAAVRDVKSLCATNYFIGNYCAYCKYNEPDGQCHHDCTPYSAGWGWQWRGVCAENGGAE